eukprot:SAG11_NODE_3946_length_2137_cov_5.418548_1_plen_288_part_00
MLVMRFRMRVARHTKVERVCRDALKTAEGAAAAAAAYAAERDSARGVLVTDGASDWQLDPGRQRGPLSLEELGVSVSGEAAGMAPLVEDGRVGEASECRSPVEPGHFGLAAEVERMVRSGGAAMAALPKAAGAVVSKRRPVSDRSRKLKADQIARMEQLEREGRSETQVERRSYNQRFIASRRDDFREMVEEITAGMEDAFERGDTSGVSLWRKRLPRVKPRGVYGTPTHDSEGRRFQSLSEVLQWWHSGMQDHWAATKAEETRPELEELFRSVRDAGPDLTVGRLD